MNIIIEDFITEKECIACVNAEKSKHSDQCFKCFESKTKPKFTPDTEDAIIARYTNNA